jgi:ParB-like chromosome segregation protein Spo0J
MELLGFQEVAIERLNLQGNFRERLDSPRIFERAKSIQRLGILSEPMVRLRDMRVIYGHDRIAGAVRAGRTKVTCKMVECTDEELHEIEVTENVQRRHDSVTANKNLNRLLELYEGQVTSADPENLPAPLLEARGFSGKARTARGIARVRASVELGIKPESVRRREQRSKAVERHAKQKKERDDNVTPEPVINLIGMEVTDEFVADTVKVHRMLQRVVVHLTSAQSVLTAIGRDKALFPPARLQRLYDEIHAVAAQARGHLPVSLCPYCKGLEGLQEHCAACLGCGWLSAGAAPAVPQDLWNEGSRTLVARHGRLVPIADVLKAQPEPGAAEVLDAEELFA